MGWDLVTVIHTDPELSASGAFTFLSNVHQSYFAEILGTNSDSTDLARALVDDSGDQLLLCEEKFEHLQMCLC